MQFTAAPLLLAPPGLAPPLESPGAVARDPRIPPGLVKTF